MKIGNGYEIHWCRKNDMWRTDIERKCYSYTGAFEIKYFLFFYIVCEVWGNKPNWIIFKYLKTTLTYFLAGVFIYLIGINNGG